MGSKPFVVLMAEDDEHDVVATKRAWKKHNIANPLFVVNDGEELLAAIRKCLLEPDYARKIARNGQDDIKRNQGATIKTIEQIEKLLRKS